MKNIKTLILKNFQQWKTGKVSFTKGLNILVGNTESGKSTLFRAINSILTGKMPEDYIRKGTKEVEVKVEFDNNTYFRRFRSKKDNIADANGKIFERVGKDIPFEYFKDLGKTNISFGNKEISLCNYSQFEPHFFITLSDYDKSKLIGTICGIDITDKLIDSINKDIRSNNSNIKFLTEQITNQEAEKELKVKEFDVIETKYNTLNNCYNNIKDNFKTLNNLSNLRNEAFSIQSNINLYKTKENELDIKIKQFNIIKYKELQQLFNLKLNLDDINKNLDNINNNIKKLEKIENFNIINVNKLNILYNYKLNLTNINNKINILNDNIKMIEQNINNYIQKKNDLLKDFDKCPLCGGVINER